MPFLSILTNSFTNLGLAGKAARGVNAPRQYSIPSQIGGVAYTFPTTIGEKYKGTDTQAIDIYINTTNTASSRTLYWTILHQTTDADDFVASSGSFGAHNYAFEIGKFTVQAVIDFKTEGAELFQIQIREGSVTGTVVFTTPVITVNDTSLTATYVFDSTNPTSIDEIPLNYGYSSSSFRFLTANVDYGTYLYYTITNLQKLVDIDYASQDKPSNLYLPTGKVFVQGTETSGYGIIGVKGIADELTEGPETFQIQLRTGSTSGPIVATSPVITVNDTSVQELPVTNNFEYQIIAGGGPVGTNSGYDYSAGGGGAGGFLSSGVLWTDRNNDTLSWQVVVGGAGGNSYVSSAIFSFFAYAGGRGAGTFHAAAGGGSGGGGSAGGGGSVYNVGGAGTPGQGNAGGKAWSFRYSNIGGGGGGYSSAGTAGGSGYSGNGGAGTTDWTGTYVCYGGGGKSAGNISGASGSPGGSPPPNTGGGGGGQTGAGQTLGGSGKVIIRFSSGYRPAAEVTGNPTIYISGSYRYYVWTSSGSIRIRNNF